MCDYCENSKVMIRKEYPSATSFGWRDDETKICFSELIYEKVGIFIDLGYLRLVDLEDCGCVDHSDNIKINFCPFCGSKLESQ